MAQQYVFHLGNHPALAAAEAWRMLERVGVAPKIVHANAELLLVEVADELSPESFQHIGGSDRVGRVIAMSNKAITGEALATHIPNFSGRTQVGLSGVGIARHELSTIGRDLKQTMKSNDQRVKFITPTKGPRLNAAQVLKYDLLAAPNSEFTIIANGDEFRVSRSVYVQDIASYERRDTDRPRRDSYVGMVPPKLAQMMINLSLPPLCWPQSSDCVVWDPFSGMGTIAQEAWLMGFKTYASDKSGLMVGATQENMTWLVNHFDVNVHHHPELFQHDATTPPLSTMYNLVQLVVTEPTLGDPLHSLPSPAEIEKRNAELVALYTAFLTAIKPALKRQSRVLLLLPTLQQNFGEFIWFPDTFLDAAEAIGYRKLQLIPEALLPYYESLGRRLSVYARPDAIVGRELTLWEYSP